MRLASMHLEGTSGFVIPPEGEPATFAKPGARGVRGGATCNLEGSQRQGRSKVWVIGAGRHLAPATGHGAGPSNPGNPGRNASIVKSKRTTMT